MSDFTKISRTSGRSIIDITPATNITPVPEGTDPEKVYFEEWNDTDVYAEKWEFLPQPKTPKPNKAGGDFSLPNLSEEIFEDHDYFKLPASITTLWDWKRPSELFKDSEFEIYHEASEYKDLISGNKHLFQSELIRNFIASVYNLKYIGNTYHFTLECLGPRFSPKFKNLPWRPWHHIYSKCGSKDSCHNPQVNPLGKYIVRLFWLGAWRKIYVDDKLPVDKLNNVLLPSLIKPIEVEEPQVQKPPQKSVLDNLLLGRRNKPSMKEIKKQQDEERKAKEKESKKVVELWPFLLCKAIIKLASLTAFENKELLDFDIVNCLTGWLPVKVDIKGLPPNEIWDILRDYSKIYTWPEPSPSAVLSGTLRDSIKHDPKPHQTGKKESSKTNFKPIDEASYYLIANTANLRHASDKEIPDLTPCWEHQLFIDQTRNVPLIKPPESEEFEPWKHFRWIDWAIEKGLITPQGKIDSTQYVNCITTFAKVADYKLIRQPSKDMYGAGGESNLSIKRSSRLLSTVEKDLMKFKDAAAAAAASSAANSIDKTIDEPDKKKGKGNKSEKDKIKKGKKASISLDNKSIKSTVSKKSVKSEKGNKKPRKISEILIPTNPSFWVPFQKIATHINQLTIYFKPSQFTHKVRVSDVLSENLTEGERTIKQVSSGEIKPHWKQVQWFRKLSRMANIPLYIFVDSLEPKMLFMNLAQTGNIGRLNPQRQLVEMAPSLVSTLTAQSFSNLSILCGDTPLGAYIRKSSVAAENYMSMLKEQKEQQQQLLQPTLQVVDDKFRPYSHIIVEQYDWASNQYQKHAMFLNTHGSSSAILDSGPGRYIFRIWIHSDAPFTLSLISNTTFNAGCFEETVELLSQDSLRLSRKYNDLSSAWYDIIQRFGQKKLYEATQAFCKTYKPDLPHPPLTKHELTNIHDIFLKYFLNALSYCEDVRVNEKVAALKILFINPYMKAFTSASTIYLDEREKYEGLIQQLNSEELLFFEIALQSTIKIQSLFKKAYILHLKSYHNPNDKKFSEEVKELNDIYNALFASDTRSDSCFFMLKKFLCDPHITPYVNYYDYYNDIFTETDVKIYQGSTPVSAKSWSVICRLMFFCLSDLLIKIFQFCEMRNSIVRVIDNDTFETVPTIVNQVFVHKYKKNRMGYTIIIYGYALEARSIRWKVLFITNKVNSRSLTIPDFRLQNSIFQSYYIPGPYHLLCKCLISVRQDTYLTLRLTTSFADAELKLRIIDSSGTEITHNFGKQNVIVPVVCLSGGRISSEPVMLDDDITSRLSSATLSTIKSEHVKFKGKDTLSLGGKKKGKNVKARTGSIHSLRSISRDNSSSTTVTYTLEVTILENSFPLTKTEWNVVENVKKKALYRTKKANESKSDKRRNKEDKAEEVVKPWYFIQAIYHQGDWVSIKEDKRRDHEIMELKRSWFEHNPGRYERGQALRQDYLDRQFFAREGYERPHQDDDSNKDVGVTKKKRSPGVKKKESSSTDLFANVRTERRPSQMAYFPVLNLEPYYKTRPHPLEKSLDPFNPAKYDEFHHKQQCLLNKDDDYKLCEKQKKDILTSWLNEIRNESGSYINNAYKMRDYYIKKNQQPSVTSIFLNKQSGLFLSSKQSSAKIVSNVAPRKSSTSK